MDFRRQKKPDANSADYYYHPLELRALLADVALLQTRHLSNANDIDKFSAPAARLREFNFWPNAPPRLLVIYSPAISASEKCNEINTQRLREAAYGAKVFPSRCCNELNKI